jgi:carbamoyl-phosphate synthase small subunit
MEQIKLILENGITFTGQSIGTDINNQGLLGEVVFNTSMTGYQEIFSDPSYCDQVVVMTYPLIGNYGINHDDYENLNPALKGIIIKEACETPSNWRNERSLQQFLKQHKIPGIAGIDTRMLTKIIRDSGTMKGIFVTEDTTEDEIKKLLTSKLDTNQVQKVSCKTSSHFPGKSKQRVVMLDFGFKKNILTSLLNRDCDVIVVPYDTKASEIEKYNPTGIMLSNGPGDPKDIPEVLPEILKLQEKYPLFAICMGHQLFALANGANTEKMKFGHRGANHPVKDFNKDRVYITSQNHGYAVSDNSIEKTSLEVTQINLNDKSIEGLKHKTLNAFSVQYHPEANPGPSDTNYLFDEFIQNMKNGVKNASK